MLIGSVHSDAFSFTLDDTLNCTSSDSGVVCDQSIIPPASSTEDNVNFADDDDVASFDESKSYLTDTTFWSISSECKLLASTISGLESAQNI